MQRHRFPTLHTSIVALGMLAVGLALTGFVALSGQPSGAGTRAQGDALRHHHSARARDAMALPFFSFAQGLRRSNRS